LIYYDKKGKSKQHQLGRYPAFQFYRSGCMTIAII
jgi:hypothetical protein